MNKQIPGFRNIPRTGVIYVMTKARELGYSYTAKGWSNLGQGSPETDHINEAPNRIKNISVSLEDNAYAPISGLTELRKKVASLYNELYRKDKKSQYTFENVCISGGGRQALTRIASVLDNVNMGHFIPDYTAYEELLTIFKAFIPIPILLNKDEGYKISAQELENKITGLGLSAILLSNPCNPTGQLMKGKELSNWVSIARKTKCSIIFDEFYSHYIYNKNKTENLNMVSAAEFVKDVDKDPIIIIDGFTKNWRYPGWRISWILGPKSFIQNVSSATSFLDGGANRPFQAEAVKLLDKELVLQETKAFQRVFAEKRNYMLKRLVEMGIIIDSIPEGTFYFWANLSNLPEPLNNSVKFFEEGLKEKVITVPGIFFDVNPGKRRISKHARYQNYCRISFGPKMEKIEQGLNALERVINKHSNKNI